MENAHSLPAPASGDSPFAPAAAPAARALTADNGRGGVGKSSRIGAAISTAERPTGEAGAPNLPTYRYRVDLCESCCGGTQTHVEADGGGFYSIACGECHRGEVDASCADCLVVRPLDDDGFCEPCADASNLPIADYNRKYPVSCMALHRAAMSAQVKL